jgi:hypothetical protein
MWLGKGGLEEVTYIKIKSFLMYYHHVVHIPLPRFPISTLTDVPVRRGSQVPLVEQCYYRNCRYPPL